MLVGTSLLKIGEGNAQNHSNPPAALGSDSCPNLRLSKGPEFQDARHPGQAVGGDITCANTGSSKHLLGVE